MEHTKEPHIQVILCEPGKSARITTIKNDLQSLQKMVGGYIEAIYPFEDPVAIICNEDGKLEHLALSRAIKDERGGIYDIIAGPFLIAGLGDEDFASLSKEHQEKYLEMFIRPEVFLQAGDKILAIPVDPADRPHRPKPPKR